MVEKLYFKENKSNKVWIILIIIPIAIILFFYIYNHYIFGTNPANLLDYTHGQITYKSKYFMSFEQYYNLFKPEEVSSVSEYNKPLVLVAKPPIWGLSTGPTYFDSCKGRRIEIDFSNQEYSNFNFTYLDKEFNYKVNLFNDLYHFSDELKNQDCYYSKDDIIDFFLREPYNNKFIEAISKDFESLANEGYSKNEILEIATLFVQSIFYESDVDNNRYPYETIYEKKGNCLDRSLILVGILKNLGFKTYIIFGDVESENHAIVGVACKEGNIKYNNDEICFIETTTFLPIASEIDISIEKYNLISAGNLIYTEENYGKKLANSISKNEKEIEKIGNNLDSMNFQLQDIRKKMCQTDCIFCGKDNNIDTHPESCWDAYIYNPLVDQHNKIVEDYNPLLKDWYKLCYETEKSMFGNIEVIKRLS